MVVMFGTRWRAEVATTLLGASTTSMIMVIGGIGSNAVNSS
jgi:hypothetical protein